MPDEHHAGAFAVDVSDVPYRTRPGGEPLLARLYRPRGAGPFPAVIEVHGGAWTKNDRTTNEGLARALAGQGILVCSIDFRMPPEAGYPAAQQDINLAIRWLKGRAEEYAFDAARLGGLGTSSGGHQILLAALCPKTPKYAALPGPAGPAGSAGIAGIAGIDASLAFVAACWPICSPPGRYAYARARGNQGLVAAHDQFWGSEAAMADGSPQHILDEGRHQAMPPALIIHGTADTNVSHEMSLAFAETYRRLGGDIAVQVYPDEPHAFIKERPDGAATRDATARIADFIRRHGGRT